MIHPDVDIVDFDPDRIARVHEVFAQVRAEEAWAYVLHRRGHVERVFAQPGVQRPDRMPRPGDAIDDPALLARHVCEATQAVRVVVIDHDLVDDLVRAASARADAHSTLQSFRVAVARTYWNHPAVETFPQPPGIPSDDLQRAFAHRGRTLKALLSLADAEGIVLAVLVIIEDGLVTSIRGASAEDTTGNAADAFDITLQLDWDDFVEALRSPDLLEAFAELIEASPSTGLESVSPLLREAKTAWKS